MANFVSFEQKKLSAGEKVSGFDNATWGIFCIEDGSGKIVLNSINYDIDFEALCLISPKDIFCFETETETDILTVSFDESYFSSSRLLPLLEIFYLKKRVREISNDGRIKELLCEMKGISEETAFSSHLLYAKLIELLCALGTSWQDEKETTARGKVSSAVIRYINENLGNSITLDDIAKSLFMSKYHMSHIFKKETGVSVGEMVLVKKMDYADHLLSMGITARRVSELTGFHSYSAFFRIYKRIKGHSPQGKGS